MDSDDAIYQNNDFLDKGIMEILGAEDLDDAQTQALYDKMLGTIRLRVIEKIDKGMNDEQAAEWKRLVEAGEANAVIEYLKSLGFDIEQMTVEETLNYKAEVAGYMDAIKRSAASSSQKSEMPDKKFNNNELDANYVQNQMPQDSSNQSMGEDIASGNYQQNGGA